MCRNRNISFVRNNNDNLGLCWGFDSGRARPKGLGIHPQHLANNEMDAYDIDTAWSDKEDGHDGREGKPISRVSGDDT